MKTINRILLVTLTLCLITGIFPTESAARGLNHTTYDCISRDVYNRFDLPEDIWLIIPYDAPIHQYACTYLPELTYLTTIDSSHCWVDEILGPEESPSGLVWLIHWYCTYDTYIPIATK